MIVSLTVISVSWLQIQLILNKLLGNILDSVLTTNDEAITSVKVHQESDSPFSSAADHLLVSFNLVCSQVPSRVQLLHMFTIFPGLGIITY